MKKLLLALMLTVCGVQIVAAAPIQLKNKLVFTRGQAAKDETVWTMNADGKEQRRVWRVPKGYGAFGGFSHDGKQAISYNSFNLYVHDLRTGRFRRLFLWSDGFGTFIGNPSFSPDGKQILCEAGSANTSIEDSHLLCLNVHQSYASLESLMRASVKPTELREFSDFRQGRWSADGKRIIAVGGFLDLATNGNRLEIWTMNRDGSHAQRVTTNELWEEMPVWNAKQDKIAFVRHFTDERNGYAAVNGRDLFIMNADGTGEERLTDNVEAAKKASAGYSNGLSNPLFNAAGDQIAFNGEGGIYRVGSNGRSLPKWLSNGELVQWVW